MVTNKVIKMCNEFVCLFQNGSQRICMTIRCIVYPVDNILGVLKDLDISTMFLHGEVKEMFEGVQLGIVIGTPSQTHLNFK